MRRHLKVFTTEGCIYPGDVPLYAPEMNEVRSLIQTNLGSPKELYQEENYCVVEMEYYYSKFETAKLLKIMDENSLLLNGYEIRFVINGLYTVMRHNNNNNNSRKRRLD